MTAEHTHNPFSSAWLERRSEAREHASWREQALADAGTRFLLASGTQHLVADQASPAIAWLAGDHPLVRDSDPEGWILLGWLREACVVLFEALPSVEQLPPGTRLDDLRPLLALLPEDEASVLACARALQVWRVRHRHCGACGAPTRSGSAGHVLACTSSECGAQFFPRIDPAVIVLVSDGAHALLGRQAQWPAGRYSCLAGFVEPGESLEDTVVREVFEESGARVRRVRYFGSQAWPFPSSLMLGFRADATRGPLLLDGELEDARWFTPGELDDPAGARLPPRHTIARRLIEDWYREATGQSLLAV
jgi:NAD+ diphosphatase